MTAIYMKIAGIDGSATAKGHNNWIPMIDLNFNVERIINTDPGRIADREGTRPTLSEITLHKKMDKSSPLLFSESCTGKAKSEVKVHICQTDQNLNPYAEITLNNVIVSAYHFKIQSTEQNGIKNQTHTLKYPLEEIALNFDKIEIRYTPYDNQNQAQSPIPAGYDLKEAVTT